MKLKKQAKESAREIRKVLKANWPDTKFSVRSKQFAGGSSVDLHWTDGPTEREVSAATAHLKGYDNGYYNEYIGTSRYTSRAVMEAAARAAAEHYEVPMPEILGGNDNPYVSDYTRVGYGGAVMEALQDKIHRAAWQTNVYGVDLAEAFAQAYPNQRGI